MLEDLTERHLVDIRKRRPFLEIHKNSGGRRLTRFWLEGGLRMQMAGWCQRNNRS